MNCCLLIIALGKIEFKIDLFGPAVTYRLAAGFIDNEQSYCSQVIKSMVSLLFILSEEIMQNAVCLCVCSSQLII